MRPSLAGGILTALIISLQSCSEIGQEVSTSQPSTSGVKYARCFDITRVSSGCILRVKDQEGNGVLCEIFTGRQAPEGFKGMVFPEDGPKSVIVISTSYLSFLEAIDRLESVKGISNSSLVYSRTIPDLAAKGKVREVGGDHALNYEVIIECKADVIFMYDYGPSTAAVISRLESLGQKVIPVSEFREEDPRGKAEWVRFFGHLYGRGPASDSIFSNVEKAYNQLLDLAENLTERPSVFTGLPWKGEWYQPGGRSFQATLFRHAGAAYLWEDDEHESGFTVDREVVMEKAMNADFWLHTGNAISIEEVGVQDSRYMDFNAFRQGNVYNNNLRLNSSMGNDYWESGIMRPHIILRDLMTIFHPRHFQDGQLEYYRKLE